MTYRVLLIAPLLLAPGACSGRADTSDSSTAGATTAPAVEVKGDVAERLLASFGAFDAVDSAMGGRADVDVSKLSCLTSSNAALDESDPSFNLPSTACTFDVANRSPANVSATDPVAKAQAIFEALADAGVSQEPDMGGKLFVEVQRLVCEGQGAGAGADPTPALPGVTCTLTTDNATTTTVTDAKARRLVQVFGLIDVVDAAMGGRFGFDVSQVQCERRANDALEPSDPEFEVPEYSCTLDDSGRSPTALSVTDGKPKAVALLAALERAGLSADSGMGKTGVSSSHVTCSRGPDTPTACSISRP
jgi:hypothetical protein